MLIVLDTNVLVSSLLKRHSKLAFILDRRVRSIFERTVFYLPI